MTLPTRAAINSPMPVAANTPPRVASIIGNTTAQPNASSRRPPCCAARPAPARVTHSAADSATRLARASALKVSALASSRPCMPGTQRAPTNSSRVMTGITSAGKKRRFPSCKALALRRSCSSGESGAARRRTRAASTPSAITPTPISCAGSACPALCASRMAWPKANGATSRVQNAAMALRPRRRLCQAVDSRKAPTSQ